MKSLLIILFNFSLMTFAHASSCCGGGGASSMIILGDNSQEFSLGASHKSDIGQTNNQGMAKFNTDDRTDFKDQISLEARTLFKECFQFAGKVAFAQKTIERTSSSAKDSGPGDIEFQSTFEFLPEYTYSPYKPRGFVYTKISIPTSKSIYDSQDPLLSNVRGSGLYEFSLGNLYVKKFTATSFKFGGELKRHFGQNFNGNRLHDFHSLHFPLGGSYALASLPLTFGITQTWNYTERKKTSGEINNTSRSEYYFDTSLFANFSINNQTLFNLSYSDSTLTGKSVNSPLYRSFAIGLTYQLPL